MDVVCVNSMPSHCNLCRAGKMQEFAMLTIYTSHQYPCPYISKQEVSQKQGSRAGGPCRVLETQNNLLLQKQDPRVRVLLRRHEGAWAERYSEGAMESNRTGSDCTDLCMQALGPCLLLKDSPAWPQAWMVALGGPHNTSMLSRDGGKARMDASAGSHDTSMPGPDGKRRE